MQNNEPKWISSLGACISPLWLVVCVWSTVWAAVHVWQIC